MYRYVKHILDSELGCSVVLQIPKDFGLGHFATPHALTLAKKEKQSPQIIAKNIIAKLEGNPAFARLEEKNGFVNIFVSDDLLSQMAKSAIENPKDFGASTNNQKILLEFVSANPTGPLHIGHARGAIFGDILARVGEHLGYAITKEYYINDAGNQIDLLGLSIFIAGREILGLEVSTPDVYYRGEYMNDLVSKARLEFGDEIFHDERRISELASFGVPQVVSMICETLQSAGIVFDNFISEKSLSAELPQVLKLLESRNATKIEDSKIWLKSSEKGDQKDRVIVRDSGESTYLASDIVYHHHKFLRRFDKYINIWGADHHGYVARVKASLEFLGHDSAMLEVILSQMVSLLKNGEPYKISKREGNVILMQDVLDEVGGDAMRFMFVSKKADTHLEFDIDTFKKEDTNNPIYYVNYANARIHTLLSKSNARYSYNFSALDSMWKELLVFAFMLPKVLDSAFNERALQQLPEYLKNLSAKLHFCYNSSRIIGSPNENSILSVLRLVSLSITTGLKLMGIEAKTTMSREESGEY